MYISKCDNCDVEYFVTHIEPTCVEWELRSITYNFFDSNYIHLILDIVGNRTILWIKTNIFLEAYKIEIPYVFPLMSPEKAILLAKKIDDMKVFS